MKKFVAAKELHPYLFKEISNEFGLKRSGSIPNYFNEVKGIDELRSNVVEKG